MDSDRWLLIQEAMAQAGVSRRTIYNWLKAGRLRFRRTIGGSVRIDPRSLWATDGVRTQWEGSPEIAEMKRNAKFGIGTVK